jgi:hypothetical protein
MTGWVEAVRRLKRLSRVEPQAGMLNPMRFGNRRLEDGVRCSDDRCE